MAAPGRRPTGGATGAGRGRRDHHRTAVRALVGVVGAAARQRGVPVIAFSTDANVAARGVYLLSFLPESDVDRIVDYAIASGKRSFAAMLSEGAYGNVVEAEFKQVVARKGGRIVALERYPLDPRSMQAPAKLVAQAARGAVLFIPEGPEVVPSVVQALTAPGSTPSACSSSAPGCGTIRASSTTHACKAAGMRRRKGRISAISRAGTAPTTAGSGAHRDARLRCSGAGGGAGEDAGQQRFAEPVLTNPSGFAGIDGLFRFRSDGTNQRGLAVLKVAPGGGQVINPPPRAFSGSGTYLLILQVWIIRPGSTLRAA